MKFKIKYTKQIVFAFIAVPVIVLFLFMSIVVSKQRLFENRYFYYTNLLDASGISTQTPILYKGFEIGRVRDFILTDSGEIQIKFFVFRSYNHVMVKPAVISRTSNPITGRTTLQFLHAERQTQPLETESTIISTDFADGRTLYRSITSHTGDTVSSILENINYLTSELTRDDNPDKGAIFRILTNVADLSEKADVTLARVDSIFYQMNAFVAKLNQDDMEQDGTFFRILANVANTTEHIDKQMEKVDDILHSLQISAAYLENPDSLLVKMIDPTGENLVKPVQQTVLTLNENLHQTLQLLETLNRNNPELILLINNLNETLNNAKKTLEGLNNNPLLRSGISTPSPSPAAAPIRIQEVPDER